MASKYRKKPVVIEAIEWTGDNVKELFDFTDGTSTAVVQDTAFAINTLEGVMLASIGDYIIKGVQGEFYPCKPDIFKATYDRA